MPLRSLSLDKRGTVAHIALKRPEQQNAVDANMLRELADACEAIAGDSDVRVVVLSGGDGPVFCCGWDREALAGDDLQAAARSLGLPGDPFGCLARLPQPVVCALNGDALSAGLELALACDVRVAAEGARLGLPETSMGLLPMAGGTQRLPRIVGRAHALELLLLGDRIDAQEAWRMGLVGKVVPQERLLLEAEALAERLAQKAPVAMRYLREAIHKGMDVTLDQGLRLEADLYFLLQTTADRMEGIRSFLEKRTPTFRGE